VSVISQLLSIHLIKYEQEICKQTISFFLLTDHSTDMNVKQRGQIPLLLPAKGHHHDQTLAEKVGPAKKQTKMGRNATNVPSSKVSNYAFAQFH